MNRPWTLPALIVLTLGARMASADDGFVPLFNGKDLAGWEIKESKEDDPGQWFVKDDILTAKPGWGWLGTKERYGDFVLRLDWRLPENGNSGVYLRVPEVRSDKIPTFYALEVQVLDEEGPLHKGKLKPYQFSGSIYEIVPARSHPNRGVGRWNHFEITCRGDRVAVVFNGETVADGDASSAPELGKRPRRGFIGLQNHGSAVEYRDIAIKVLDGPAAK